MMSLPAEQETFELTPETAEGELEVCTALVRRFLGIEAAEPIELTAFVKGRIWVHQCTGFAAHVQALSDAESIRGFSGAYMLVNGPMDPALCARYPQNKWDFAHNGRATDKDIQQLRAIFIDVDPIRPKGISSTDEQLLAACEVAWKVREWIDTEIGDRRATGIGCSGNGYFLLIALQPIAPSNETTRRVSRFLQLVGRKFGTDQIKIDASVSNPARLMAAPGTWKRKGISTPERPHRLTTFVCAGEVARIPLEALC